jgi:hypothetical protein
MEKFKENLGSEVVEPMPQPTFSNDEVLASQT